jgi:hypothetical protein
VRVRSQPKSSEGVFPVMVDGVSGALNVYAAQGVRRGTCALGALLWRPHLTSRPG